MANLQLVGAVGVRVRPDTKNFRRDAKREILAQLEDIEEDVNVRVNPNVTYNEIKARDAFKRAFKDLEAAQNIKVVPTVDDKGFNQQLRKLAEQTVPDITAGRIQMDSRQAEQSIGNLLNGIDDLEISLGRLPAQLENNKDAYARAFQSIAESTAQAKQAITDYERQLGGLGDQMDRFGYGVEARAQREAELNDQLREAVEDQVEREVKLEKLRAEYHLVRGKQAKEEIRRLRNEADEAFKASTVTINAIKAEQRELSNAATQAERERKQAESQIEKITKKLAEQRELVKSLEDSEKDRRDGYESDVVELEKTISLERDRLDAMRDQLKLEQAYQAARQKTNEELGDTLDVVAQERDLYRKALKEGLVPSTVKTELDWLRRRMKSLTTEQLADLEEVDRRREESHQHAMDILKEEDRLRSALDLDPINTPVNFTLAKGAQAKIEAALAEATRGRSIDIRLDLKNARAFALEVIGAISGLNVARRIGAEFKDVLTTFDQIAISAGKVTVAIAAMTTALGASVGAASALASDLGELTGLLLMAPSLFFTLGAAVYTGIKGFEQFKAAAQGDAEALATFGENGQAAARAIGELGEMLNDRIKPAVWDGIGESMTRMAEALQGPLVDGLEATGEATGRLMSGAFRSFEKFANSGRMAAAFEDMVEGLNEAADATEPLFDGINLMGQAGARHLPALGRAAAEAARDFSRWSMANTDNGNFERWIQNATNQLQSLGTITASTVGIVGSLGRAADRAGFGGLASLAMNLRDVNEAAKGEFFQANAARLFSGALTAIESLGRGFRNVGAAILEESDFIEDALVDLGATAENALTAVADAFGNERMQAGAGRFFDDLREASEDLGPMMDKVANGLGDVAGVAGEVVKGAVNIADAFLTVWDSSENISASLETLIPFLSDVVAGMVEVTHLPITAAMDGVSVLIDGFMKLPEPIRLAALAMGALVISGRRIGDLVGTISNLGGAVRRNLGDMATNFRAAGGTMSVFRGNLARLRVAASGLTGFLGGPWGLAFAGATIALASWGQEMAEQRGRINDFKGTFDEFGNSTQATVDTIANSLNDMKADWWDADLRQLWTEGPETAGGALRELGMTSQEVAGMLVNDRAAYDELASALVELGKGGAPSEEALRRVSEITGISADKLRNLAPYLGNTGEMMQEVARNTDEAHGSFVNLNGAVAPASQSSKDLGEAFGTLSDEAATAEDKVRALKDAIDILNGGSRSAAEAEIAHHEALRDGAAAAAEAATQYGDLSAGLKQVGDGFELDTSAEEASVLAEALSGVVDPAYDAAMALHEQGKSAGEVKAPLQEAHAAWMGMATQMGLLPAEAQAVWDSIVGMTPDEIVATMGVEGGQAMAEAESVINTLGLKFDQKKFIAWLEADPANAELATNDAAAAAQKFAQDEYLAKLGVDQEALNAGMALAEELGQEWDAKEFTAWLQADGTQAKIEGKNAQEIARLFAEDQYNATFTADGSNVQQVLATVNEQVKGLSDSGMLALTITGNADQFNQVAEVAKAKGAEITNPDAFRAFISANAEDFMTKGYTVEQMLDSWATLPHEVRVNGATEDAQYKLQDVDGKLQAIKQPATATVTTVGTYEALTQVGTVKLALDGVSGQHNATVTATDAASTIISVPKGMADRYMATYNGHLVASDGASQIIAIPQWAADKFANDPHNANITATDGASMVIQVPQGAADHFVKQYNGTIVATDGASSTIAIPQSNADAFIGDYNGNMTATDSASNTIAGPQGAANDYTGTYNAHVTASDGASGVLGGLIGMLDNIRRGATAIIDAVFGGSNANGSVGMFFAEGGITKAGRRVQKFADGGFSATEQRIINSAYRDPGRENHRAMISRPVTPFRVWAEPETGGEAYIPLASSKRARSTRIWEETGKRLGVDFEKYADGGFSGGGTTSGMTSGSVRAGKVYNINVNNHYPQAEPASTTVNKGLQFAATLG
jgi:hypothetical protein